jgi:hypothetical protein
VTVTAVFEKDPVPVTGVSVTPSAAELVPGSTLTLTAAVTPLNADNKAVTWTSSNSVATVSGTGLTATVTAVSAGAATITATTADGSFTASCAVTVKAGAGLIVNFNGFGDESIDLTLSTENDLSKGNDDRLTVTYAGPGSISLSVDGQYPYGIGSSVTIYASNLSLGIHYLSAVIDTGAGWVSKEVSFRVVE